MARWRPRRTARPARPARSCSPRSSCCSARPATWPTAPALDLDHGTAALSLAALPGADPLPPYLRLIHDALIGDRSLFTRPDGLASVWKVASPLLSNPPRVASYAPGSWGPAKAGTLITPGRWLLGQ